MMKEKCRKVEQMRTEYEKQRKKTAWAEDSFSVGAREADMVWDLSHVFSLTLNAD